MRNVRNERYDYVISFYSIILTHLSVYRYRNTETLTVFTLSIQKDTFGPEQTVWTIVVRK